MTDEEVARIICKTRQYDPDALGWPLRIWGDGLVSLAPTDFESGLPVEPVPLWQLFLREAQALRDALSKADA